MPLILALLAHFISNFGSTRQPSKSNTAAPHPAVSSIPNPGTAWHCTAQRCLYTLGPPTVDCGRSIIHRLVLTSSTIPCLLKVGRRQYGINCGSKAGLKPTAYAFARWPCRVVSCRVVSCFISSTVVRTRYLCFAMYYIVLAQTIPKVWVSIKNCSCPVWLGFAS